MKILYINYWSITDPLTETTVFPNLKIIQPYCSEIYLATVERDKEISINNPTGLIHVPYFTTASGSSVFLRAFDFIFFYVKLLFLAKKRKIDLIICRGSMAAAFGIFLNRTIGLRFIVESFEPHADYMAEGNTWRRGGLKYRFQKWIEQLSMKLALYLLPVSKNYADFLIEKGVAPNRIVVMPCCVDLQKFSYNEESRNKIRKELGVNANAVVGIYVGKFGDIYLKEEAFDLFKQADVFFKGNFFLIILSSQNKEQIIESLGKRDIPQNKFHVEMVPHDKVPEFLSAADFSFSLVRPSPSKKYCCPVKNGEYWANGLPILIPPGIGDDGQIIIHEKDAGVLIDFEHNSIQASLEAIQKIISQDRSALAKKISLVANRYRNFEIIDQGYKKVFTKVRKAE